MKKFGINGNILKIVAAICMVFDHVGYEFARYLSPSTYFLFRFIGRVTMPIFAFLIAEGCRYTKKKDNYLCNMLILALICDLVYLVFANEMYYCILTGFSFGIIIIYTYQYFEKRKDIKSLILFIVVLGFFISLTKYLESMGAIFDYSIYSFLIPLFVYVFKNKWLQLLSFALCILAFCLSPELNGYKSIIKLAYIIPIILIALYNGERGKLKLKYFFYLFYPIHLVLIEGIYMLIL